MQVQEYFHKIIRRYMVVVLFLCCACPVVFGAKIVSAASYYIKVDFSGKTPVCIQKNSVFNCTVNAIVNENLNPKESWNDGWKNDVKIYLGFLIKTQETDILEWI